MPVAEPKPDDYSAFERLFVDIFLPLLPSLVHWACLHYHYRPCQDEVEDLCQELSYLLVSDNYRGLRSFDPHKSSHKTWLAAVTRHHIERYLKQQRVTSSFEELAPKETIAQPEQEREHILAEKKESLWAAIRKLTPRERHLLQLCYKEELGMEEIARRMKIKVHSASQLKYNALVKLRKLMRGETEGPKN